MNTKKCKFVPGTDCYKPTEFFLKGKILETVDSNSYLGKEINNKLHWSQYWERIIKNTNSLPFLIKQLGFKSEILMNVFKSQFISQLDCNSPVLMSAS